MEGKLLYAQNTDLKAVPLPQAVEALDRQSRQEQVAVVKLPVENRRQALQELQALLARHQITIANPVVADAAESPEREAGAAKDAELFAVYVDASDDRLAAVLKNLQQQTAFEKLQMEAPLAVAQLDALAVPPPAADFKGQFRKLPSGAGFGGGAGGLKSLKPQVMRTTRSPNFKPAIPDEKKPLAEPLPQQSKKEPGKTAPEAHKDKTPILQKAPAPRIGIAKSSALPRLADGIPPAKKRDDNAKAKSAARRFGVRSLPADLPSTQRELRLSPTVLNELRQQITNASPQKTENAKSQTEQPATPRPLPPGKRMQVLFILVDKPQVSGKTPPAP